ncbi:trna (guanine-n-)-methyltransferase [Lichtheimia corymbifera JMRC:FSU:9682]|uniref:tRNA (guanine(9)-N1)-methyltransferase n=1 Tax=Lichtheimia corymbifera JMRC:FSU:9682 TaxID=1263082 RepID=A0A068S8S0_9FUNG|nr:trna (guanine-n-)-methyltransferase [Lichtheimia corymbifera JMRC:FSU:9682]
MADDVDKTNAAETTQQQQIVLIGEADSTNPNIRKYKNLTYDITDPKYQGLSKNALKRILKEEHWNATRDERNKRQKEKHKKKHAERRKLIEEGVIPAPPPKRPKVVNPSNVQVAIDCSFSSYMNEKEVKSLQAQLVRCYSANRHCERPMHLTITSFDDLLKGMFDTKEPTYSNWKDITFTNDTYLDKFDKSKLVYLSADSDNTIEKLDEDKVYIIGGIVDKNRYKNLCQNKAQEQGIETARLPIGEYLQMASRKVLTVNHVYEIMLKWLENEDWNQAFKAVIPGRKLKDSKWLDGAKEGNETQQEEGSVSKDTKDDESIEGNGKQQEGSISEDTKEEDETQQEERSVSKDRKDNEPIEDVEA